MEKDTSVVSTKIIDSTANPAPLGLLAFGMTTVLLNFHNAGLFGMCSMILAMGIFYGGIAQIIAGIMEWKKNNTFGATAFISYGSFWLTLVALIVMPKMGLVDAPDKTAMAAYLIMWGIFSTVLFYCTFKISRLLQFVFGTLVILFFLLAAKFLTGGELSEVIEHLAGYVGIICGGSAILTGFRPIINELYNR